MSVNPSAPPRRRRAISTRFFTSGVNFAMRYLRDLPRRTHDGVDRRRLLPEADAAFFNIGTGKVHLQRHADEVAWVLLSCAGKVFLLVRKKLTTTGHRLLRRKENNGRRIARRPRSGGRWSSASRAVLPDAGRGVAVMGRGGEALRHVGSHGLHRPERFYLDAAAERARRS